MASLKIRTEYALFSSVSFLLQFVPRKICLALGRFLGFLFYAFDKRHRRVAFSNLQIAFGRKRAYFPLKKIARRSFQHFGAVIFDLIKLSKMREENKRKLFSIEGEEHLKKALKREKGVLLFSGHYGNWEAAPILLTRWGRLSVVARPLDNPLLEKKLLQLRESLGATVFSKFQAARPILRSLSTNGMVAILIDQNVLEDQAVFVDFFGLKAATTPSLATFFLRTQAPLLPVFCFPTASASYHIKISPPIEFYPGEDFNDDVLKITELCTKIIENQIRQVPEYWLWFHNRWKTRPDGEKGKNDAV